jgi:hypothetical protein
MIFFSKFVYTNSYQDKHPYCDAHTVRHAFLEQCR